MIKSIATLDCPEGLKFWAIAFTVNVLSDWGVSTSVWLHDCMCSESHTTDREKKQCRLKGRRAINLACGAWKSFVRNLEGLTLDRSALTAISNLENIDTNNGREYANFIQRCFQDCRDKMKLRCIQAFSFWDALPYSCLELGRHFADASVDENWSRARALELMNLFDSFESKTSLGAVSWLFFGDNTNRNHIMTWAKTGKPLPAYLHQLLFGYCTSLTVMQRLEAKHHLANVSLTRGRALSVPGVVSGLRRRLNRDLIQPSFRSSLSDLLNQFDQLVPQAWDSHKQLLEIVYGFGLEQLHPNISWEEQQLQRIAEQAVSATPSSSRIVACLQSAYKLFPSVSFVHPLWYGPW